jgi:hypothetical protein
MTKADINEESLLKRLRKPLTRRQALGCLGAVFGPPLLASIYGFGIEPQIPEVEQVTLSLRGFPGKLRAVHISDLHIHRENRLMTRVADLIREFEPDCIFLTGDLVESDSETDICLHWLSGLEAKAGIYFAPGNWEHWSGSLENNLSQKLASIGVKTLFNSGRIMNWGDGHWFLGGIDDAYYGSPDIKRALEGRPERTCTVLLSHSPVGAYLTQSYRCDLVLSGHTHGGQVRLPRYGAIKTPPGSGPFEMGLYHLRRTKLYVNRGIGNSVFPIRLFCPPEVTYLTILPSGDGRGA